jgi:hypothetical protein
MPDPVSQSEYKKLSKQLDAVERSKNNTLFNKVRRKVRSLYMNKDKIQDLEEGELSTMKQRVVSSKHHSLLRRVEAMEKKMYEDGNK